MQARTKEAPKSGARLNTSTATTSGRRPENEDCVAVLDSPLFHGIVIADGMGGHLAGEVASRMVVDGIEDIFRILPPDPKRPQIFGGHSLLVAL